MACNNLPKAFQAENWDDEDEYEEEEDDTDGSLESRQKKASSLDLIQVSTDGWTGKVISKISIITGRTWDEHKSAKISDAIEKAAMATCILRRGCNSTERIEHHERLAREADPVKKDYHQRKADKAKTSALGVGTGMLLPRSPRGYLVIANNHVIMNSDEAKDATVTFKHFRDDDISGIKKYNVDALLDFSPLTTSGDDKTTLDYSILLLKAEIDDPFLKGRGIFWEESNRIQAVNEATLKLVDLKALPLIMFSHPRNLAMRVSVGPYPAAGIEEYPVGHIEHKLPSLKGSSGANLLLPPIDGKSFTTWHTAFVHYRHGRAVAWQAIAPQLRQKFYLVNIAIEQ